MSVNLNTYIQDPSSPFSVGDYAIILDPFGSFLAGDFAEITSIDGSGNPQLTRTSDGYAVYANLSSHKRGVKWEKIIPAPTTTPAPVTTTPAPVVTTTLAPVITTTPAPVVTTTLAPVATTIAPTTTPAPVVKSSNLTTLQDYIEIRDNLLSALKELSKVTINQYSVQERQVIHERRSEIRKEIKFYDRKIALLEKTAKGFRNPSLEHFRQNDAI